MRLKPRPRNACPPARPERSRRASPIRDSLSAGTKSVRVDCSAGGALIPKHYREHRVVLSEHLKCGVGEEPADESPVGVGKAVVVAIRAVHLPLWGTPAEDHERLRLGYRQRTQKDRIHEAEDCRVGPDSQGQRQDRHRAEGFVGGHRAQAVAEVLRQLLEQNPRPQGARVFPQQRDVAQVAASGPSGLVFRKPVGLPFTRFFRQMEPQLLAELVFLAPPLGPPRELPKERGQGPSSSPFIFQRPASEATPWRERTRPISTVRWPAAFAPSG